MLVFLTLVVFVVLWLASVVRVVTAVFMRRMVVGGR